MSFSPLPQSQWDTWFCLHQGTYSYSSGGILILQENYSNLLITKVWKKLQNMLMHYFPPSSSPTKPYQRELMKTEQWRWTPLLLGIGETNPVQQLPAALAIPIPEQKGHQTLEHAHLYCYSGLCHMLGTCSQGTAGPFWRQGDCFEHGLKDKMGSSAVLFTSEEVSHQHIQCKSFQNPLSTNSAMKLLHWIIVVNAWWTEYKVWMPAAVRCDCSFSQRISSTSFHTSSWYSQLTLSSRNLKVSNCLSAKVATQCVMYSTVAGPSRVCGTLNHYCDTSSQICIITMIK